MVVRTPERTGGSCGRSRHREITPVDAAHRPQVPSQWLFELLRKHGDLALPVLAIVDGYLAVLEVQALDPEPKALPEPQARAVEEDHDEVRGSLDMIEDAAADPADVRPLGPRAHVAHAA